MSGGGSSTTTQVADPWSGVQPYLKGGFEQLGQLAGQTPQAYGGQSYADFNPWQTQGMGQSLDYAQSPVMNNMLAGGFGAMGQGFDATNPEQNPMLANIMGIQDQSSRMLNNPWEDPTAQSYISEAIRPLQQQYSEQILPGIRDQAEMYGGAGSRTGLAEGVASRGLMDATSGVASNVVNNMYNRNLANQLQAAGLGGDIYGQGQTQQARMMGFMPQMQQAGLFPSNIMQQVGGQLQGQTQQGIDQAMQNYYYNQNAPWDRAQSYVNTLQGTPWGSSTSTGPGQSTGGQIAGAGMSGLGTYMMMGGPANPLAIPAALAMGGLGLFG